MARPLEVAELDHVVLRCRNLEHTLDFYTRILGLKEERRLDQLGLVQLRAGRSMVDLVPAKASRSEEGLNVDHFCLGVEAADLNAAATYLRENGVEVLGEPVERYGARGTGQSIYVRDPEGNRIELKQMPRTA
jgi:catechol 2,3-dioxygenase-like lactoylglutathione lyase family enzyme